MGQLMKEGSFRATGDCNICGFYKSRGNRKYSGVKIPGGMGKCCREGGHCSPRTVGRKIGEGK
jgi:hypothetical protein